MEWVETDLARGENHRLQTLLWVGGGDHPSLFSVHCASEIARLTGYSDVQENEIAMMVMMVMRIMLLLLLLLWLLNGGHV